MVRVQRQGDRRFHGRAERRRRSRLRRGRAGPDEWTVAVADHGDWCAVLAIYPTPAASETEHREALFCELYAAGLASSEVTAPDPAAAELATRRWFAADRADVDPDATCKPLAFPETRIPGPNGP
ncbi:hypothetical protein ACWEQL_00530 [Kitasatospora sp. NPDC004240]